MTISKFLLVAASVLTLSSGIALANTNSAVTDCALNTKFCVDGPNLVGTHVTSFGKDEGGTNISNDNFNAANGEKSVKTFEQSPVNYDHGVRSYN